MTCFMGIAYRTLLLSYDLLRLPPDAVEKVSALLKVQEGLCWRAEEWLRGEAEKPRQNPLKYLVERGHLLIPYLKHLRGNYVRDRQRRHDL